MAVIRYVDCTYLSKADTIELLKARGIVCEWMSKSYDYNGYDVFCVFIGYDNCVDTFFSEEDAYDSGRELSIDGALEWYINDYAEDEDVVFEELILKGDCIKIGTL